MDLKSFASAVSQLSQEKGLPAEKIIESIETALAAAYKKEYGEKSQVIKAKLDPKTGHADFWQVKTVVDDSMIFSEEELEAMKTVSELPAEPKAAESSVATSSPSEALAKEGAEAVEVKPEKVKFNPEKHIMLEEARQEGPSLNPGDEIKIPLEEKQDFGRIAAQTAKQVIIQKIREAEKETIFADFKLKEGEIISGVVQRIESRTAFMDIGKTTGVLNREEQVPGEFYRPGQRLKAFVLKVEQTSKGPIIFLSRAYPKFVSKLFELEVPEISAGQVVIKSIAREAGSRTKIAVVSLMEGIDPIGAAVGQRGTRVSAVINELGGEKIDIIEYSDEPDKYIANALSPAKIMDVRIMPKNKALAVVPTDQLSLAIGKDGQNVRLAAKLTGWKIDVRSPENIGEALEPAQEEGEKDETEAEAYKVKAESGSLDEAQDSAEPQDGKDDKDAGKEKKKTAKKAVKTKKTKKTAAKKTAKKDKDNEQSNH
jgi:N utilization substance protein A